ncbi:aminotransferase class I/II-fold pyridoxal phosphate-dependent enzyme [Pseudoalteromonas sp. MMG022]|uniref:aminotransferase class I/II-fold pyridoxal phosphate-dependent enzyme n=1 Tax=Pseudoalteromonas sp. MMG022 TaxID=2909978 RepID=UPI001F00BB58|nr:aminotransferase class I/II-fold pyridoxal phosphate-dependent enzyme [Pseudoalteromonas sp. MMG022]MCF6436737.1 aminotransferase class I/II-fold pyridoxal phosphate-dependent enzyme [Pseudoalteromonas sp. MMG022]
MSLTLSKQGNLMCQNSPMIKLAKDINMSLASDSKQWLNLGVGNPLITKEVEEYWLSVIKSISAEKVAQSVMSYGSTSGDLLLRKTCSELLNKHYGWETTAENILVTNGSQSLFFMLNNIFSGQFNSDSKKIFIPALPEYVGYSGQILNQDGFDARLPTVKNIDDKEFIYKLDIENCHVNRREHGAMILSFPSNPTGKCLSEQEWQFLVKAAENEGIPLIIDCAYGNPFPGLCHQPIDFKMLPNLVYSFSFSKAGIPGSRIGIAVADSALVANLSLSQCNATIQPNAYAQLLANQAINHHDLSRFCHQVLRPMYSNMALFAKTLMMDLFKGINWKMHQYSGGMFLWIQFSDLKCNSQVIYEEAKKHKLIIVPGDVFFFGVDSSSIGGEQCIRISLAVSERTLIEGLSILKNIIHKLLVNKN